MRVAERATGPLADSELDILFAPFAGESLIAIAVSGGPDSLALMVAADRWRQRRGGLPELLVLTVDHRLRRGSGAEARMVAALAAERGLAVRVLVRKGDVPRSDVEGAARRARYRLLLDAATEAGASHLLTAHHRDDVAEGFLLRLARGSGLFGLAAMRRAVTANGIVIARPFLGVARERLAATATEAGLTPVVDPMNADPRFARSRMRALLPRLAAEGIDPARIAETASRLADATDAIEAQASDVIAEAAAVDECAIASLDTARWGRAPREVRRRVLARLIRAVGGGDYPPRFTRLAGLLAAIEGRNGRTGRLKRTLGGTVIEFRGGRVLFYREAGRAPLPTVRIQPGRSFVWDHRFSVEAAADAPRGLTLAALGDDGRRMIEVRSDAAPAAARAALPAVRRRRSVLAVPGCADFASRCKDLRLAIRPILEARLRQPPLFPDFGPGG